MEKNLVQCFMFSKSINNSFLGGVYKAFKKGIIISILLKGKLRLGEIKYFAQREPQTSEKPVVPQISPLVLRTP